MATPTSSTPPGSDSALRAYEDKVAADMRDAKGRLEQFAANAKDKAAQAEVAAVNSLKTAQHNIDRKLQDLKGTHAEHMARAKADIDADVATFKASVDDFASKFKASTAKK